MTHFDAHIPLRSRFALRARAGFIVSCLALAYLGLANAEPAPQAIKTNPSFVIKGFDITGDNPLPEGEVSRILAPYLRTDATLDTLQKATADLEAALKDKGFALHRVALPPQEVGQSVTLNIVKFVIGKVTVEGNVRLSDANIRASIPELAEGLAPNFKTLAVQTTIANESQGKRVQVALKESDEADKIDARIVVKESKPWNFAVSLNNSGSTATGQDRFTVSGGHSNLWDLDHQLTAAYTTSLQNPASVRQLGLNYRAPLYRLGGVLGLSYTRSDLAGDFGSFKSTGAGRTAGLSYSHYLPPDGGYRGTVEIGLDDKQFDVTEINGVPLPGQSIRKTMPLSVGYSARVESDSVVWGYAANLALNAPGSGANDLLAYQSEDPRVSTVRWRALRGGANYATGVWGTWLWSLRGQFQYSPDALISGEQFGLGGASSVRGTTERPIAGDSGLAVSTELTTPEISTGLRLVGFVDAGWLNNNAATINSKPANDGLASLGLGLRYVAPNYSLTADFGRIVAGSSVPAVSNTALPQAGDQRLHVSVSARF
jgi:hemolysin activation/secretion protein